jgi:hypothetical protein
MRRTFVLAPSMIALIVVALLVRSAGFAAPLAGEVNAGLSAAAAHAIVDRASGRATDPDGRARSLFLHAQAQSTGRVHAPVTSGGDGPRSTAALGVECASLAFASSRAPGAAVDAREHGVSSPGQPAPSSRAPPIG